MARVARFEEEKCYGTLVGTENSGVNFPLHYNYRDDGADEVLKKCYVLANVTVSATNYYAGTIKNDAGSTVGTFTFASGSYGVTTPVEVSLTAANCLLAAGEGMYISMAQTGNGMTINGLTIKTSWEVHKV